MNLIRDQKAQASAEYILMLALAVSFVLILVKKLLEPAFAKFSAALQKKFDDFLGGADLHHLKIGK
jgi:hypothetical protein